MISFISFVRLHDLKLHLSEVYSQWLNTQWQTNQKPTSHGFEILMAVTFMYVILKASTAASKNQSECTQSYLSLERQHLESKPDTLIRVKPHSVVIA